LIKTFLVKLHLDDVLEFLLVVGSESIKIPLGDKYKKEAWNVEIRCFKL
jgi:hypothetical protein